MKQNIDQKQKRIALIEQSARQVGRPIFHSILIIVVSFLPVFLLTGQEGRLFHPLAWTKTLVILSSMVLTITWVPALMAYFMKGKMRPESNNPVSSFFVRIYQPILRWCLRWKKTTLALNIVALAFALFIFSRLGQEFMPPLNEGTLLFMPVALPDASNAEMKRILQIQDRIIASVPEVKNVLGKAGRIASATDPAPLNMIETIIELKPRSQWRRGLTRDSLIRELNQKLQIPGVTNGWTQPIINRINMLNTGIRTDAGVKVFGQQLDTLYQIEEQIARVLKSVPGVVDLYPEPLSGGRFLDISIRRDALGRYGISTETVNHIIEYAIGGASVSQMVEGRERFSINVRLGQDWRQTLDELRQIPIQTAHGPVPLSAVADIHLTEGPSMINSENALLRGTVLFDVRGRDMGSTVEQAMRAISDSVHLPPGYFLEWSGQWENQVHARKTLKLILPIVLFTILFILYLTFDNWPDTWNVLLTVPFGLTGGILMVYFWGAHLSVAVVVGFIALFGLVVETGVVMIIYLDEAIHRMVREKGRKVDRATLEHYVMEGAVRRLRPKLMTVFIALLGLVPVLWSEGTGIELMRPIALPMIGGVISSAVCVLLAMPVVYQLFKERELKKYGEIRLPISDSLTLNESI
ncbi:MAG: efflux RND transporter permease subunit [Thermoflavifilum aggregans]|nr:efflux RND transporter permease subunit [Thermoflavifilum aggregans]